MASAVAVGTVNLSTLQPFNFSTMTLKKQTGIRIVGICAVARRLGCSPSHLRRVITGERPSKRLVAKARELGIRLPQVKI